MFYEKDDSMALMYEYYIFHSVVLADLRPEPTWEFKQAYELLPAQIATKQDQDAYQAFINDFGTHYMTQAYMGGMALATNYYHSCFLQQFQGQYVWEQTSRSFFGIFNDGSASGRGWNRTDTLFEQWSDIELKLLGGDAEKFGQIDANNTCVNITDIAAWKRTIRQSNNKMVPLAFSLAPITDLIADPVKRNLVNATILKYSNDVATKRQSLVDELIPKDPYIKPDWCKFSPKPPPASSETEPAPGMPQALPDCPALPGSAPAEFLRSKQTAKLAREANPELFQHPLKQ